MRPRNSNANDFLSNVIPYVEKDGARDFNQISREMRIPYQTLRSRMLHLKDQGLYIFALPNFNKLGLERVRAFFSLPPEVKDVKSLMGALHQSAGLKMYARSIDSQIFDCEFAIPQGSSSELAALLEKLQSLKMIREPYFKKLLWKELPNLKAEYYDFPKSQWDVDFSRISGNPSSLELSENDDHSERIDLCDLMIIKELELNPWIKTVELCHKTGGSVGDTAYHLNKHVFGKRLIKSFKLRWDGSPDAWLKHSIVFKSYFFKGISTERARHAMSVLTSIPFIWSHMMMEDGSYMAEMLLPISYYAETTRFISSKLGAIDLVPTATYEKDWSCLSTFTIPYSLFNKERSWWDFRSERALEHALAMVRSYTS